jgi:hypothetical protein
MGLRRDRKRKVLRLLDEDPDWAAEVLKKDKPNDGWTWAQAAGGLPSEGLRPDLQNASQHIEQRRGVYFKCDSFTIASGAAVICYYPSLQL